MNIKKLKMKFYLIKRIKRAIQNTDPVKNKKLSFWTNICQTQIISDLSKNTITENPFENFKSLKSIIKLSYL